MPAPPLRRFGPRLRPAGQECSWLESGVEPRHSRPVRFLRHPLQPREERSSSPRNRLNGSGAWGVADNESVSAGGDEVGGDAQGCCCGGCRLVIAVPAFEGVIAIVPPQAPGPAAAGCGEGGERCGSTSTTVPRGARPGPPPSGRPLARLERRGMSPPSLSSSPPPHGPP
jgi:hypothetical protein